jgi:two-component sensor histidine kinase
VTVARAFTLATMERWRVTDRDHDVAAVVSELLTNALRHALPEARHATAPGSSGPWPIRLGLLHFGRHVVCAVADPSKAAPVSRQPDWQDESGRGLQVIASLSDQWGYCPAPAEPGKVVWAAFATRPGLVAVRDAG